MTMAVDPIAAVERWLAPLSLDTTAVLFVIGFGDGHVLDALDRRAWTGRVVALEPNAAMAAECLSRKPVRQWQLAGRLTILAGPDYVGLDQVLGSLPLVTEKPVIAGNPQVTRVHREVCVHAARVITRAWFGARANDEARKKNAGRYLANTRRNADAIVREGDAAALKGVFPGLPALVVAAGPSLDRNLADIARYRDRAVIIAADTALRPLLAAGVEPNLVVATDPTETNARHLNDLPSCERTHLVAEGSVEPESLPHFAGRTFFFRIADHHPWPWLRQAGHDRAHLRAWGSVLTTAFDLALMMGCEPIVFAGADLAFTDGRPYARGTTYEEVWRRAEMWGQPIEDCWSAAIAGWPDTQEKSVTGDVVRTAPHLRSFRDWIASEAAKAAGRTIINGTGGGILLGDGIVQQSLAQALSMRPVVDRDVTGMIAAARRSTCVDSPAFLGEPDEATLAAWQAFAGPAVVPMPRATVAAEVEEVEEVEVVFDCVAGVDLNIAIEAAWRDLPLTDRRLVLRDQTGSPGGASVRRALFGFVERHPDVSARFGRFYDPDDDRSWIDRRPGPELFPGDGCDKWQEAHVAVANRLTPLIVEKLGPRSVIDVGCGAGFWLQAFNAFGVSDVTGVGSSFDRFTPSRVYDLCLCLGVVQRVAPAMAEKVIDLCTRASDTVVFSVSAPAVGAPGYLNERPSRHWHGAFLDRGFAPCDELRPAIEERMGGYGSEYDLMVVYRRIGKPGELAANVRESLLESAVRIDDLVLQTLWHTTVDAKRKSVVVRPQPRVTMTALEIVPARMEAAEAGDTRRFRFRTAGGALALAAGLDAMVVTEDLRPVTFVTEEGAVTFRSSDGSDPRRNGRRYVISVPAHVSWLERQPLTTILENQL